MSTINITMHSGAEKTKIRVFVFWGQSNMNGQGDKDDLTGALSVYAGAHSNIQIYGGLTSGAFQNGEAGVNLRTSAFQDLDYGPELSFLYDVAASLGETVYGVKYAPGGVPLESSAGDDWNINSANELYNLLIYKSDGSSYCQLARGILDGLFPNNLVSFEALIGVHGEQDAIQGSTSYEDDFGDFINDARIRLNNGGIRIIYSQLTNITGSTSQANINLIKTAQANIQTNFVNTSMIDASDLDKVGGATGIHYTSGATITLGQRMATAYLNSL